GDWSSDVCSSDLEGGSERQDANGNVQTVGEGGDLAGPAVGAEVFEYLDGVAAFLPLGGRKRIFDRFRDPQPAAVVEGDVHRLMNVRFGGDQLCLETGPPVKRLS